MKIELPSSTPAELVRSGSVNTNRGLVIIPDIFSLRPLFGDMCTRLAEEYSCNVCSFDLFPGDLFPERSEMELEERLQKVSKLSDSRILEDAAAAADALECESATVIGFCLGGMYTLKAMSTGRFERGSAFYGMIRMPKNFQGTEQGEPLEMLKPDQAANTMAIIGTKDAYTPPAEVQELEDLGVRVVRYEGCDHGFVHDPERPAHRPKEAADAWRQTKDFLGF